MFTLCCAQSCLLHKAHPGQAVASYSTGVCDAVQVPPIPFEEKLHAIAYINSNCGAPSGRSDIMRKLMALGANAKVRLVYQHAMLKQSCQ
jgi:hypothetical protein